MYYLYILYNNQIDKYYVGQSADPWARIIKHNSGDKNNYTGKHGAWQFAGLFTVSGDRSEAMRVEKFIKRQKSRRFVEKLLDPAFVPTGELAQLVRVPHLRD